MKNPLKKKPEEPRRRVNRSSSVKVNKYISPNSRKKDEPKNKRKAHKRRRALLQIIGILLVTFAMVALLWTSSRVTEVVAPADQQEYQDFVSRYVFRNPVSSFKPFITEQGVEKALLDEYPEVESASVRISFFGPTMDIDVVERQAQLVLKTNDNQYFTVDRAGYAYEAYDPSSPNDKAVILTDDTDVAYDLQDNRYLPVELVEFIEKTETLLKDSIQFSSETFSYRITDEARVVYVKPSKQNYEVKMQQDRSAEQQVFSLLEAFDYYKKNKINPSQYVDVRVVGTVYYK